MAVVEVGWLGKMKIARGHVYVVWSMEEVVMRGGGDHVTWCLR